MTEAISPAAAVSFESSTPKEEFLDITALCRSAALLLDFENSMISHENFSLFESMSAVELMDPKMDQCYNTSITVTTEDLLTPTFPASFTFQMCAKLIKILLVYETAFLEGASVLESTHQCVFLWPGSWPHLSLRRGLPERVLLAYSRSLSRSIDNLSKGVLDADIYEDEDFQAPNRTPSYAAPEGVSDEGVLSELEGVLALVQAHMRMQGVGVGVGVATKSAGTRAGTQQPAATAAEAVTEEAGVAASVGEGAKEGAETEAEAIRHIEAMLLGRVAMHTMLREMGESRGVEG